MEAHVQAMSKLEVRANVLADRDEDAFPADIDKLHDDRRPIHLSTRSLKSLSTDLNFNPIDRDG